METRATVAPQGRRGAILEHANEHPNFNSDGGLHKEVNK